MEKVEIVTAKRTPIGKYKHALREFSAVELGAIVMKSTIEESGIAPKDLDFYLMGNTLSAGLGQNPARIAALKAGIPAHIGGFTIDQVCASSLTAIVTAAQKILSGRADIVLAGGMESMSRARFSLPPDLRWGTQFRPTSPEAFPVEDLLIKNALWDVPNDTVMGKEADRTAKQQGITRKEVDRFAYQSHKRAADATEKEKFQDEIVPVKREGETILAEDEGIRPDTNPEVLSTLPPIFMKDGIITAGNASQLSDGASAVLLLSKEERKELGLNPMATISDWDTTFNDPKDFIRAPVPSVRTLLDRNNKTIEDIDLFEHNEAFACASILVQRALGIDSSRLNIRGGAVAMGHPIGASGARILTTLLHAMKDKAKEQGVATLCHGGGGAMSLLVTRT